MIIPTTQAFTDNAISAMPIFSTIRDKASKDCGQIALQNNANGTFFDPMGFEDDYRQCMNDSFKPTVVFSGDPDEELSEKNSILGTKEAKTSGIGTEINSKLTGK